MPELQPNPPSGLVAGKYEVLRLIGRGGMGAVWEGRHTSLGTSVAIKFIDAEYAESHEARSRFDNEARAAAALQSKHAIHIFDHGVTEDGRPYMVMELLVGEALDARLERQERISLQETARILAQVCRALQRAHEAGIIHRDLKPENIFLVRSPDDDDEVAKVLDFGIAKIKALPWSQGASSSTKTGAVLGTPYYMAPEQARGLRSIDSRADLWSLGVIAYKCVTGILPFEGESVGDLLVKICTAPPPVPSVTAPGLPAAFDAWFARTMEREPAQRFATASELADALMVAAGLTARRPPPSVAQPPALAPTLGPGTAVGVPGAGLTSAPFVTSNSPPKAARGRWFAVVGAALLGGGVGVIGVIKLLSPGASVVAPVATVAHAASVPQSSAGAAGTASTGPAAAAGTGTGTVAAGADAGAATGSSPSGATPPPTAKATSWVPPNGTGAPFGAGARGKPVSTRPAQTTAATAAPVATARPTPIKPVTVSSDPGY
jgi:serine/threonine-protein kinase